MQLTKIGKVVCLYCGSDAPHAIRGISQCPNCGAKLQKLTITPVNIKFDSRRVFTEDKRIVNPQ